MTVTARWQKNVHSFSPPFFSEALGEEFFLSTPHRDWCFCWSPTQPSERQARHAQEALEDFLQDDYNLTPDILRYSHGDFRMHREQIAA